MTPQDVEDELRRLAHQRLALDLITRTRSEWAAGPVGTVSAARSEPARRPTLIPLRPADVE